MAALKAQLGVAGEAGAELAEELAEVAVHAIEVEVAGHLVVLTIHG